MNEEPLIFTTASNPKGILSVNSTVDKCILAYPDTNEAGYVQILHLSNEKDDLKSSMAEFENLNEMLPFKCHEHDIAALKLSQDGKFLVTASTRGTKLRVWKTEDQKLFSEVTRGSFGAQITDINIDITNSLISCSSEDKGTVHVFSAHE